MFIEFLICAKDRLKYMSIVVNSTIVASLEFKYFGEVKY